MQILIQHFILNLSLNNLIIIFINAFIIKEGLRPLTLKCVVLIMYVEYQILRITRMYGILNSEAI